MTASLRQQTSIGVIWSLLSQFLQRGTGGLVTLVLAWFLAPEDFGLVAMMAVFLALSNAVADGGFKQALIRKRAVSQVEFSTAFYSNMTLAVLIYGALYFSAPLIAQFYEQSELTALIRVAGLATLFNAVALVHVAVLSRQLNFKVQLRVAVPATFLSGVVAIGLAYFDLGVWALVAQIVTASVLTAFFYWLLGYWRPSLAFSISACKELASYGGFLLLDQLVSIPFRYMYIIVIAKTFAASISGLYFFADRVKELLISQLVNAVQTVTLPALSRLQEDNNRLKEAYREVISATTFLVFPILLFVAALTGSLFHVLLPEKWLPAVPYLQLMCLAGLVYPLNSINLNILRVKGRSDLVLYLGLVKKITAIAIFVVSFQFGIIGILVGQIIASVVAYLPNSYYSKKLIDYSVVEQLTDFMPSLLLAGGIAFLAYGIQEWLEWPAFVELLVLGFVSGAMYIGVAYLFGLRGFRLVWGFVFAKASGATKV